MAWADSRIYRQYIADMVQNTAAFDLDTDVPKVALYGTAATPDRDATAANSAYAATWSGAAEITDATNWVAGGRPLVSAAVTTSAGGIVMYDASDTAGAGNVTISAAFGCLVYDDTIATPQADQGLCFNYFGGSQSVTAGTFTVVWHANGIFRIAV